MEYWKDYYSGGFWGRKEEKHPDDDVPMWILRKRQHESMQKELSEKPVANQSSLQQEVNHPFVKSEDSNSSLILQDEAMEEQSDDEFWEDFERVLQDGYEEEAPKEDQSPIQQKVNLPTSDCEKSNNTPLLCQDNPHTDRYEGVMVQDPFWEASCQKQLDGPTHIMEYLKDLVPMRPNSREPETQSAIRQGKNRNGKWCATLPGESCKGNVLSPGMYHYFHPCLIASEGCFVLNEGA